MVGGGEYWWETDLAPAARSKGSSETRHAKYRPTVTVTVSVIVYTSYHYDTCHSIYNILFRYIIKNEKRNRKLIHPCCHANSFIHAT